jgi:hypothetical protein
VAVSISAKADIKPSLPLISPRSLWSPAMNLRFRRAMRSLIVVICSFVMGASEPVFPAYQVHGGQLVWPNLEPRQDRILNSLQMF